MTTTPEGAADGDGAAAGAERRPSERAGGHPLGGDVVNVVLRGRVRGRAARASSATSVPAERRRRGGGAASAAVAGAAAAVVAAPRPWPPGVAESDDERADHPPRPRPAGRHRVASQARSVAIGVWVGVGAATSRRAVRRQPLPRAPAVQGHRGRAATEISRRRPRRRRHERVHRQGVHGVLPAGCRRATARPASSCSATC